MDSKENYLDSLLRSVMEGGQAEQNEEPPEEILDEIPEETSGELPQKNSESILLDQTDITDEMNGDVSKNQQTVLSEERLPENILSETEEPAEFGTSAVEEESSRQPSPEMNLEEELSSFLEEIENGRAEKGEPAEESADIQHIEEPSEASEEDADELMRLLAQAEEQAVKPDEAGLAADRSASETDAEAADNKKMDIGAELEEEEAIIPGMDLEEEIPAGAELEAEEEMIPGAELEEEEAIIPGMDLEEEIPAGAELEAEEETIPGAEPEEEEAIIPGMDLEEEIPAGAELEAEEETIPGAEPEEEEAIPEIELEEIGSGAEDAEPESPEPQAETESVSEAPNASEQGGLMSQEDIESLLASMEIEDVDEGDGISDDEMASFLEQFPELGEEGLQQEEKPADAGNQDLLGITEEPELMDLMSGNEELEELSGLLDKEDNQELFTGVDPEDVDLEALGIKELSDGEKEKKKLFGKKRRKKTKKGEEGQEGDPEAENGESGEKAETEKAKNGFLAKISQLFFEEIGPEEEAEEEQEEDKNQEKGKKGKKKSKKKKDENEEILEEIDAEDNAAKKKKGKKNKKGKKDKRGGKEGIKELPDEAAGAEKLEEPPAKKLPAKKIAAVGVFAATLLASILLLELLLPGQQQLKSARRNYAKGDYQAAYQEFLGIKLKKQEDIDRFKAAEALMSLERRYLAYENYRAMEKETRALDSLIRGIKAYSLHSADAQEYGVTEKYDEIYGRILDTLANEYGISEELAGELAAVGSATDYTVLVTSIAEPDVILDTGEEMEEEIPQDADATEDVYEDLDGQEAGTDVAGEAAEAEGGTPGGDAGQTKGGDGSQEGQESGGQEQQTDESGQSSGEGFVEPSDGSVLFEFKVDKEGNIIGGGAQDAGSEPAGADEEVPEGITDAFTDAASPL